MTQPLALSSGETKVRGHAPRWLNSVDTKLGGATCAGGMPG